VFIERFWAEMTKDNQTSDLTEKGDSSPAGETFWNRWSFRLMCAAMFCVAFSLPLGRSMAALSLVFLAVDCIRDRYLPRFSLVGWCAVAFIAVAFFASYVGINPTRSFAKIHKLFWFAALPVTVTLLAGRPQRMGTILRAFVGGCTLLSLQIIICRPIAAWLAWRAGEIQGGSGDYLWAITDFGSMTDGQMLMIGIVAQLGLILSGRAVALNFRKLNSGNESPQRLPSRRIIDWFILALLVAALVINLKRGSWICTLAVAGIFIAVRMKLRYLLIMGVAAIAILMLPPVLSRFEDLRQEFDTSRGGRIVMWTKIAPALIKAHPLGIGYRALTPELMQEVAREQGVFVEGERDHLHSTPIQVLVGAGWAGLAVYLLWMISGIGGGLYLMRKFEIGSPQRVYVLSLVLMLLGLIINGLIEYNFGDAELVVPYAVILGIIGGGLVDSGNEKFDKIKN
jgi:hypothetical protein